MNGKKFDGSCIIVNLVDTDKNKMDSSSNVNENEYVNANKSTSTQKVIFFLDESSISEGSDILLENTLSSEEVHLVFKYESKNKTKNQIIYLKEEYISPETSANA
jgi:hypothetical protein